MKVKSYIDSVKYKKLTSKSYFIIAGWCLLCESDEEFHYCLEINGKEHNFELQEIIRNDVYEKMKKYAPNQKCGFRIYSELDEIPKKLNLFVSSNGEKKSILSMNKKKIESIKIEHSMDYHLDYIRAEKIAESVRFQIGGWGLPGCDDLNMEYKIKNSTGKEEEKVIRLVNRDDLYRLGIVNETEKDCGFTIEFVGLEKENYYFEISNGESSVRKLLKYDEVIKMNAQYEKINMIKTICTNINAENIAKGCKYLKKNGFKKLVQRLKKGVNANGMPYDEWYEMHKPTKEQLEEQRQAEFQYQPKFSIIVPTYNTPEKFLREMIDSVCEQTYSNWELCIADGSGGNVQLESILEEYASKDPRIKYKILEKNFGIAGNTNGALALATGDYVGLFDHDDLLTPDALYEITKNLQEEKYDILYTDEDKVNEDLSKYMDPNFKPDWSPDLFYSHNYITHFFVVKKEIMDIVGGFRSEYDGSQDYDLMFRCIENAKTIKHIPMILYHWRIHAASVAGDPSSKMYAYDAGKRAIEGHFERTGMKAKVEHMPLWGMYHVIYETPGNPLVSIIIPNKDHVQDLDICLKSLYNVNTYQNFEVIIVENNSENTETFEYYQKIEKEYKNLKVVTWTDEFNYAAINNYGVSFAKGNYLLFLNNDTEVINEEAISELLGCCMREDVGIVGAKLFFEDDTVQHAGIVLGFGGFAGHVFTGIDKDDYGYMVRPRINCNYSAVTAACMMVDRESFEAVDGFREEFKVGLNDVDFCLKVRKTGKLVVYNAHSLWHHYESKSRGYEDTPEKIKRFEGEIALFQKYWGDLLEDGDPYYNRNFPINLGPFQLG